MTAKELLLESKDKIAEAIKLVDHEGEEIAELVDIFERLEWLIKYMDKL